MERLLSSSSANTLTARRKQIGAKIRALRRAQGLAQARLGEILGIDQSHLSNIERGVRSITVPQLTKLSKTFRVSIDELLGAQAPTSEAPSSLRSGRMLRRLRRIEELPLAQQKAILKILDGLLDQHGKDNGHRATR